MICDSSRKLCHHRCYHQDDVQMYNFCNVFSGWCQVWPLCCQSWIHSDFIHLPPRSTFPAVDSLTTVNCTSTNKDKQPFTLTLKSLINLILLMFLDCSRKPQRREETQTQSGRIDLRYKPLVGKNRNQEFIYSFCFKTQALSTSPQYQNTGLK